MTTVTADRTLAEVVTADPAATRVFEAYALDYCCGGRRRIDEACATAGVDVDAVLVALDDLGPAPDVDWASMGPAGELLATLRNLTDGYEAPADGCASYRDLYDGLAELEADVHLHVHKENNLLFPAVLALEEGRRS